MKNETIEPRADAKEENATPPETDGKRRSAACTSGVAACGCSRCTLYRWYPPLLVVSTVLAGVFCVLYLTKPVHVVLPQEEASPVAPVAVPEPEVPAGEHYEDLVEAGGADIDPMLGGLPGEAAPMNGLQLATRGPSSPKAVGGDFRPLQVEGPPEGLFVPGRPPVAPPEAKEEARIETAVAMAPESPEGETRGLGVVVPEVPASELVMAMSVQKIDGQADHLLAEGSLEESEEPWGEVVGLDSETDAERGRAGAPVPPASIIGEFYGEENDEALNRVPIVIDNQST